MITIRLQRFVLLLGVGLALVGTGCAATRIDWGARIGSYTYDQAVTDLGPPDKQATLTDGTRVADWMTRRGGYRRVAIGPYIGYDPYGYGSCPMVADQYVPDSILRLVFDSEGTLTEWKKLAR